MRFRLSKHFDEFNFLLLVCCCTTTLAFVWAEATIQEEDEELKQLGEATSTTTTSKSNHDNAKVSAPIAFGSSRPSTHVPIVESSHSSISPKIFFSKYVINQRAVLFKQATHSSPAYNYWTDDYFLQLADIPKDHDVLVESRKKENRTLPPTRMPFKEFVKIYNLTDQYMVEPVPSFLRKDFTLPHHLQCEQLMKDIIVEAFMWYSSGGTSSVVHTDSVENMNCLVAGQKRFVFVPPKYKELVLFDHPEGAYSGIDVDDVDYNKYPGLAQVEFMHADMEAGDCLYIPYNWIHQVRSFNRNIAVNIWWDTFRNNELKLEKCDSPFDPHWSLDRVEFTGFSDLDKSPAVIRDHISGVMGRNAPTLDNFAKTLGMQALNDEKLKQSGGYEEALEIVGQIFKILDVNGDGKADKDDLEKLSNDHWSSVAYQFQVLVELVEDYTSREDGGEEDGGEEDGGEEDGGHHVYDDEL